MKKTIMSWMCVYGFGCILGAHALLSAAEGKGSAKDEQDYRKKWLQTESVFGDEYDKVVKERDRKRDIKLYMQMAKDYIEKKDNPAALFCFKKVVELETGKKQEYTAQAQEYIIRLEDAIQRDVVAELSSERKENMAKRRKGLQRILARKPPEPPKPVQPLDDPDAERRRQLEAELLMKRKAIEEEMRLKRLALDVRKTEMDGMLQYAAELFKEQDYDEAISIADKVLAVDPANVRANELKTKALLAKEEQKTAIERSKEEARLALEMLKRQEEEARDQMRRQEEEAKRKADEEKLRAEREARQKEFSEQFTAAKAFYQEHNYREAIKKIKAALAIDPENSEAKLLLATIKAMVTGTMNELDAKAEEEVRLAYEATKRQKEEETKRILASLKKKAEEERQAEIQDHISQAKEYFQGQQYSEAIREFKAALVLEPTLEEPKEYLAEIKKILEQVQDALSDEKTTQILEKIEKENQAQVPAPAAAATLEGPKEEQPMTDEFIKTGEASNVRQPRIR